MMPLLNYTTSVASNKTILDMQKALVGAGATQVMTSYQDGKPTGLSFTIDTPHGPRSFTIPVLAERVQAVLKRQRVERRYQAPEHAERVAWRIAKDWLLAQLAIISTEMVTLDQVMLPYMHTDGGPTVYELYLNQQLALTTGGPS